VNKNKKYAEFIKKIPGLKKWSHAKFRVDRFSRFDVYWIQTERQTSKVVIY